MAIRYEIYDGTKTYMYPNGTIATPEKVVEDFPAVNVFPHVVEINGNVFQAIYELESVKNLRNIPEETPVEETLVLLQEAFVAAQNFTPEPSAEERIAAALEFQNLNSM
jgi:hypothetical protein